MSLPESKKQFSFYYERFMNTTAKIALTTCCRHDP